MDLLEGAERWITETGPGSNIRDAPDAAQTQRAAIRLREIIDSR